MGPVDVIALLALAMLEGSLVALPRAGALRSLARLQSPGWCAILPASILAGTFLPLWRPQLVPVFLVLSAVATPLLALFAAMALARGPRALLVAAITTAIAIALAFGANGSLAAGLVTGFGCMSLGIALARLAPRPWLILAVVATAALDASLLALHVSQPAAALLAHASAHLDGRAFDRAVLGPITIDYPDLILAGALGGFVAGEPLQRRTAASVAFLTAASGTLLLVIKIVPETVPIAVIFIVITGWQLPAIRRLRAASRRALARSLSQHAGGFAFDGGLRKLAPSQPDCSVK